MGNKEVNKFTTPEFSPLQKITDDQLVNTLTCKGFSEIFNTGSLKFASNNYGPQNILHTGASAYIKRGAILDNDYQQYSVTIMRDLDNAGIMVHDQNGHEVAKINYRDRRFDGSLEATPKKLLRSIGNYSENDIPDRSNKIGATAWYYSSDIDKQPPGRKSVEFSIVSSDPKKKISNLLLNKQASLPVNAEHLASFIDDPFAYIPFDKPTQKNINKWWTLWWHIVQRGLRDKSIPYPGQVSQAGFSGFFKHVLQESKHLLSSLGYTHLSGVPTWYYVWNLNLKNGFMPENSAQHDEALDFFNKMYSLPLPDGRRLNSDEVDYKSGLYSWVAVAPFMLQLAPDIKPKLEIDDKYNNNNFDSLYNSMKEKFIDKNGKVHTYPLAPDRNLWHSIELKNL